MKRRAGMVPHCKGWLHSLALEALEILVPRAVLERYDGHRVIPLLFWQVRTEGLRTSLRVRRAHANDDDVAILDGFNAGVEPEISPRLDGHRSFARHGHDLHRTRRWLSQHSAAPTYDPAISELLPGS